LSRAGLDRIAAGVATFARPLRSRSQFADCSVNMPLVVMKIAQTVWRIEPVTAQAVHGARQDQ